MKRKLIRRNKQFLSKLFATKVIRIYSAKDVKLFLNRIDITDMLNKDKYIEYRSYK